MTRRLLTMIGAFGLVVGLMAGTPAWAVNPDEMLSNPVLEKRARDISQELRCLVCQNQSIDDSDAELARDLRVLVRERLIAGDTNEEAIDYIVARYGDYVLLNPPLKPETYILWASPAVLAILALLAVLPFIVASSAKQQTRQHRCRVMNRPALTRFWVPQTEIKNPDAVPCREISPSCRR